MTTRTFSLGVALTAAGLFASVAAADQLIFRVTASNTNGSASFNVSLDPDNFDDDGNYMWTLDQPKQLWDTGAGALIGELTEGQIMFNDGGNGRSVGGQVNMNFAVVAGNNAPTTQFSMASALVAFTPVPNAEGRASAAYSVTDFNGDGVTLTGTGPNSGGYVAQYNGFVPGGSTFAEVLPSVSAGAFGSNTLDDQVPAAGFQAIGTTVANISSLVSFELTQGDLASGTTTFEVVPEPTSLALLGLAGLAVLRRRS